MKKIKITLSTDGTQKIEVLGAEGEECLEFSRALEERLGMPAGERILKEEYYENEAQREEERSREKER